MKALESFLVAAETLNFSETAVRRNTVQSAISTQIRKLEEEIGRPLFERGRGQTMHLTPEGRTFVTYARRILTLADEAMETVRDSRSLRTIRLGTTVTLALSVLPHALRTFARVHPTVRVHVLCERSDRLPGRLDLGEIDIAFMMDQGKRTDRIFVENTPLAWAAGPGFRLDPGAEVPLVFLTDGRDLRRHAFEALDRAGQSSYIAHLSPHPVGLRAFVLADLALTVMPEPTITPPLRVLGEADGLPRLATVGLSLYRRPGQALTETDRLADILNAEITGTVP